MVVWAEQVMKLERASCARGEVLREDCEGRKEPKKEEKAKGCFWGEDGDRDHVVEY